MRYLFALILAACGVAMGVAGIEKMSEPPTIAAQHRSAAAPTTEDGPAAEDDDASTASLSTPARGETVAEAAAKFPAEYFLGGDDEVAPVIGTTPRKLRNLEEDAEPRWTRSAVRLQLLTFRRYALDNPDHREVLENQGIQTRDEDGRDRDTVDIWEEACVLLSPELYQLVLTHP